jgi:hypothetical protein
MPDNAHGYHTENCVHMWGDQGKWNDALCSYVTYPQDAMCEKIVTCN